MTIAEYIKMIEVECGEIITPRTAKLMMERDAEHEAEAIAGGKYVDSEIAEQIRVSAILAKPYKGI